LDDLSFFASALDRPGGACGWNMATPVPPRCDADHNFCDDSE
jgi:hypothetical protein